MGNEQRFNPHFLLHSNPRKTGNGQQIFNRAWMPIRTCFCCSFQCCRERHWGLQRSDGGLCCLCEECGQGNIMSLLQSRVYGFYFIINYLKLAHVKHFTQQPWINQLFSKVPSIFYFSISGPLFPKVPGITSLHNTTRLDNINYEWQTFCWFSLAAVYAVSPSLCLVGLCGVSQSLHHSPCYSMSDRLEDRSSESLGCDMNCKSQMNTYKWKINVWNNWLKKSRLMYLLDVLLPF